MQFKLRTEEAHFRPARGSTPALPYHIPPRFLGAPVSPAEVAFLNPKFGLYIICIDVHTYTYTQSTSTTSTRASLRIIGLSPFASFFFASLCLRAYDLYSQISLLLEYRETSRRKEERKKERTNEYVVDLGKDQKKKR